MRPNRELAVYGLYIAGGSAERIHTEDVALKCWELFPDAFSWTKYPQYPDKDIVRVALTDARKQQYGSLVTGRVEGKASGGGHNEPEGWLLTENGLAWIKENADQFGDSSKKRELKTHRQVLLRRVKELTSSELYKQFEAAGPSFSPNIGELAAFLRCRVDANSAVWERRLADIRRLGIEAGDGNIGRFAAACSDVYQRDL